MIRTVHVALKLRLNHNDQTQDVHLENFGFHFTLI